MISYVTWDIDPTVFHGIEFLRWYGLCWVFGMLAGYQIMLQVYKSESVSAVELDKLAVCVMVGAILGARTGHILFYDPIYYWHNPIEILPFKIKPSFQFTGLAGLASHGGILGALIALYVYTKKFKKDYLFLLDRLTIAGAAVGAFIRFGNLMNSEIIGTPSTVPWAFVFTSVDQIPRHPSQLYESIFYFVLSVTLYLIWKSKKFYHNNGFIFGLGITLIFTQRFLIEFLKENQVSFEAELMLNMGQILSVPMVLAGMFVMVWSLGNFRTNDK
jgi:phosphatidylglycerol---prolipoprotein diacylglyceryl transferase